MQKLLTGITIYLLLLSPNFLWAHLNFHISASQICNEATDIVHGSFSQSETLWIDQKVYTKVTFNIQSSLKGQTSKTLDVIYLGGVKQLDKIQVSSNTSNNHHFQTNALLFLKPSEIQSGVYQTVRGINGEISLSADGTTLQNTLFASAGTSLDQLFKAVRAAEAETTSSRVISINKDGVNTNE